MNELKNQKIQVLDVEVNGLKQRLEEIGASKIYEDMATDKVSATMISYELGKIDLDIISLPSIPSFLEVNMGVEVNIGFLSGGPHLDELLEKLNLTDHQIVVMEIEEIYHFYGVSTESLQRDNSENYKGPSK